MKSKWILGLQMMILVTMPSIASSAQDILWKDLYFDFSQCGKSSIRLAWLPIPLVRTYSLYRKDQQQTEFVRLTPYASHFGTDKCMVMDRDVFHGYSYSYYIEAVDKEGNRHVSETRDIQIPSTIDSWPVHPQWNTVSMHADADATLNIEMNWTPSVHGNGYYYVLRKRQNEETFTSVGIADDTTYTDKVSKTKQEVRYTIQHMDHNGCFLPTSRVLVIDTSLEQYRVE